MNLPAGAANAMQAALQQMQQAQQQLAQGNAGPQTQQAQQQAAAALAQAQQAVQQQLQQMREQEIQHGPPADGLGSASMGKADTRDLWQAITRDNVDWGRLPGHLRDQIRQAMKDGYPGEFEELIKTYYKGLAEGKK